MNTNLLRSEWTKLRSIRSTWIAAIATVLSSVLLGVITTSDLLGATLSKLPTDWDPTAASFNGLGILAPVVIGMLGALSITTEHGTGMINTTVATVPSRSSLLAAKATVVAVISLVTSVVTTVLSFAVVQLILAGAGLPAASVDDVGVLGAVAGATLYLVLAALIGLAVGVLTHSTAGSLAVLGGAMLLVPAIAPGLPGVVGDWFSRYWPITAGRAAYTVVPTDTTVAPWLGIGILTAATAVVAVIGHAAFRTRDIG